MVAGLQHERRGGDVGHHRAERERARESMSDEAAVGEQDDHRRQDGAEAAAMAGAGGSDSRTTTIAGERQERADSASTTKIPRQSVTCRRRLPATRGEDRSRARR